MRLAQHANDIRSLIAAADTYGVALPDDLTTQAAHLADLEAEQRTAPAPAAYAADLARHLGDPAGMTKARAKAAADLATAEAHGKITAALADRCAAVLHQRIRTDRQTIAAAFGEAVAAHLATLTTDAGSLPAGFQPEHAADLPPETFAAWSRARDAHAALEGMQRALAPLYGDHSSELLTIAATHALRYTAPPERFTDPVHAYRFARALAGTRHGGSDLGALTVQGVFAPTACAQLGATFAWATPAEVARRAEQITAATIPPRVDRDVLNAQSA